MENKGENIMIKNPDAANGIPCRLSLSHHRGKGEEPASVQKHIGSIVTLSPLFRDQSHGFGGAARRSRRMP
jgi:hypothetical protein